MTLRRFVVQLLGLEPAADKLRLEDASLCVDCESLSPARGTACLACGGIALLSLKRVLGGIRPEETARLLETDNRWLRFTSRSRVSDPRCHRLMGINQQGDASKELEGGRTRHFVGLAPRKKRA